MNLLSIIIVLCIVYLLVYMCNTVSREGYYDCSRCGNRIPTAQVYADPNNSSGLGWVL